MTLLFTGATYYSAAKFSVTILAPSNISLPLRRKGKSLMCPDYSILADTVMVGPVTSKRFNAFAFQPRFSKRRLLFILLQLLFERALKHMI